MFEGWEAFYQLTGEAAATLIGLLFLVVSLMSGRQVSATASGQGLFTSPTVFHMVSVLVISGVTLAPNGEDGFKSVIIVGWAITGAVFALTRARGIRALPSAPHWSDFWWYGFAPTVAYLALAAAMTLAWMRTPHAAGFTALCLMALLVVAIRNAWDLVTWLAPRRDDS